MDWNYRPFIPNKIHDIKEYPKVWVRSSLSSIASNEFFNWLEEIGYYEAPASAIHSRNYEGALCHHSREVVIQLNNLSYGLNLKWSRPESLAVVGILHDVIKAYEYKYLPITGKLFYHPIVGNCFNRPENTPFLCYDDNPDNHGLNSLNLILSSGTIELTEEERYCIAYHQGAFVHDKNKWIEYNDAIRRYPNVLFTHTADMMASQLIELGYNYTRENIWDGE